MACKFCFNAYVWKSLPHEEEEYFDGGLDNDNDGHSVTIGNAPMTYQMYFNSGMGKPCEIEFCKWGNNDRWNTIGRYYPKYCPECGRELSEYKINERGSSFERVK